MNAAAIAGGNAADTVRPAEAVPPLPPLVDVTADVVLVYGPETAPVTTTLNWHCPPTAIVAPVNEIDVGFVNVTVPPQTVADAVGTVNPAGNVSVKPTPVRASWFAAGLVRVNVSELVAPSAMGLGLKAIAIPGGRSTSRVADDGAASPPFTEVTLVVLE